jgi:hypothetical protein
VSDELFGKRAAAAARVSAMDVLSIHRIYRLPSRSNIVRRLLGSSASQLRE